MFITPERIGHSKTRDIASLMITAIRAVKLIKCTQTISFVTSSVNFKLNLSEKVNRKRREIIYRDKFFKQKVELGMWLGSSKIFITINLALYLCNVNTPD